MDQLRAEFTKTIQGMEWEQMVTTLNGVISDMFGENSTPLPSTFHQPSAPNMHSRPLPHQYVQPGVPCTPAGPYMHNQQQLHQWPVQDVQRAGVLHHTAPALPLPPPPPPYMQQLHQWPVKDVHRAGVLHHPAPQPPPPPHPPPQYMMNNAPVMRLQENIYPHPVTFQNGPMIFQVTAPSASAAPPPPASNGPMIFQVTPPSTSAAPPPPSSNAPLLYQITNPPTPAPPSPAKNSPSIYHMETPPTTAAPPSVTKRRKQDGQQEAPYIKKPINAFMLFMKEQKQKVASELNIRNSATLSAILGRRWSSMSHEEQAKYFELAHNERRRHSELYPNWRPNYKYGGTTSVKKRRASHKAAESEGEGEQDKKSCEEVETRDILADSLRSVCEVMEFSDVSPAPSDLTAAPPMQTTGQNSRSTSADSLRSVSDIICNIINLPQVSGVSPTPSVVSAPPSVPLHTDLTSTAAVIDVAEELQWAVDCLDTLPASRLPRLVIW